MSECRYCGSYYIICDFKVHSATSGMLKVHLLTFLSQTEAAKLLHLDSLHLSSGLPYLFSTSFIDFIVIYCGSALLRTTQATDHT